MWVITLCDGAGDFGGIGGLAGDLWVDLDGFVIRFDEIGVRGISFLTILSFCPFAPFNIFNVLKCFVSKYRLS